jgi:predicted O-methyltransferase YrrM
MKKASRLLAVKAETAVARNCLRSAHLEHAQQIFSYTTRSELEALLGLALACPEGAVGLEIGSHLGASTCYLVAGLARRSGHLFCVDTWQNETMPEGETDTFEQFRLNTSNVTESLTIVRKQSSELEESDLRLPLDFVFIDGDHAYEAVRADFNKVRGWMSEAGVIAFHDFLYFEGVSRVVGEALASGQWRFAGQAGNLVWVNREPFPFR